MTKNEVLAKLGDLGNEKRKQMYIKNGAGENTYGVLLGDLRKLANLLGTNHELALELWQSGNTDSRWRPLLFDAKKLTLEEARSMVSQLTYFDIIDKFVGRVVCNHKNADILAEEWLVSNKDNLGRAGWNLIVHTVYLQGLKMNCKLRPQGNNGR